MSTEMDNLVLEHLRHIRGKVDRIAEDIETVKLRLNSVERSVAGFHDDLAIISRRLDQVDSRMNQVETRLDIAS